MRLCHCNENTSLPFEKMKRYSLTGNRHTMFMVTMCATCNNPVFFPHDNFELAINEGTEQTMDDIAQLIIKWIRS